jgi:hypothetical protein
MQSEDCPLRSLLSDQRIAEVLKNEGIVFGEDNDSVDKPVITLWALLRTTRRIPSRRRAWGFPCDAAST